MRRIIVSLILSLVIFGNVNAVTHHLAVKNIDDIRDAGSKRQYLYYVNDTLIGEYSSQYDGIKRFEGIQSHRFDQNLTLDFSPLGRAYKMEIMNKHFVDDNNRYVGDDMGIVVNGSLNKLYLKNGEKYLEGWSVRDGGEEDDIMIPLGADIMTLDQNLIDMYELYLASKTFMIGDTITDSIFLPQNVYLSPAVFVVEGYDWVKYGDFYDSAFTCHFSQPSELIAYINKNNKLLRVDQGASNLKIELQETVYDKLKKPEKSYSLIEYLWRFPLYLVFFVFCGFLAFPFIRNRMKKIDIYLALVLGGAAYYLINLTLIPLQQWYSLSYIIPAVKLGNASFYMLGIVPSLMAGFLPQLILLLPILIIYFWRQPKIRDAIILGIMTGLGFGLIEACVLTGEAFQTGAMGIISWDVFGRLSAILFHGVVGAAFGYAVARGWPKLGLYFLVLSMVQVFASYLIIFVQVRTFDMAIFYILTALIYLASLLAVYFIIHRFLSVRPNR